MFELKPEGLFHKDAYVLRSRWCEVGPPETVVAWPTVHDVHFKIARPNLAANSAAACLPIFTLRADILGLSEDRYVPEAFELP